MSDQYGTTPPPPPPSEGYGQQSAQGVYAQPPAKPKKKRKIFLWVFLAIQLLFIVWIIAGLSGASGNATDCGTLDQETCDAAEDIGTGVGVILIVGIWMVVDFFLAIGYGIYRLARRP